jgi:hypothetical protein
MVPPSSTPGAAPTGARPQAKVATRAQVQAYATKKGIPYDAAVKEFQAAKYQVQ